MTIPKNASVSEDLLKQAIDYRLSAARMPDSERLEVPARVRQLAGPVPPHRGEGLPAMAVILLAPPALVLIVLALIWFFGGPK